MTDTEFSTEEVAAGVVHRVRQDILDVTRGWAENSFPPVPTVGVACNLLLTFLLAELDEDQMREFMGMLLQSVEGAREITQQLEQEGITDGTLH
jgi:hypothetical protein